MALVGADGSGKTTLAKKIRQANPNLVKYMYMGASIDSSNFALPTSRLLSYLKRRRVSPLLADCGALPPAAVMPNEMRRRIPAGRIVKSLALANRIAEEWYRQLIVWIYRMFGHIVLCDRHFLFDYVSSYTDSHDEKAPLSVRIHSALLNSLYPKPDLVIFLDATPQLLHRRKPEWGLNHLERQREHILALSQKCHQFVRVNAAQSIEDVVSDVIDAIQHFQQSSGRI